jgi:hypothetical protein
MKLTKRQPKRVVREEYSRLKKIGLIREYGESDGDFIRQSQNREKMTGIGR